MDSRNWLVALTGLAFVVLAVVGGVIMGEPPDPTKDSAQEIIDFYKDNDAEVWISAVMAALASTALVFFGGYLRKVLRVAEGEGHILATVVLAGTVIVATALAFDATINIALVETADEIDPAGVQALAALWHNDFIPFAVGLQIFALAAGLSVLRHGALPKWLGWIALLIGIAAVTPIGFFAFLAAGLWIALTSVMLAMRERSSGAARPGPAGPGLP